MKKKKFENYTKDELIEYIIKSQSYGLVWAKDKVEENIVKDSKKRFPILKEQKSMNIKGNGTPNYILKGDNYESLSIMQYTHKEEIDVIYIDPPYNTENKDFLYNDTYVNKDDLFRHSKWLNFMEKRLKLSKKLLSNSGFIAISIDDNELFNLKILCDRIFNESNYLNTISVLSKSVSGASGGGEDKRLKKNIEYVLIYAKNKKYYSPNRLYEYTDLNNLIIRKNFNYNLIITSYGKKKFIETLYVKGNRRDIYKISGFKYESVKKFSKKNNLTLDEVYIKYANDIFASENAQTSIRDIAKEYTSESILIKYTPNTGRNKGNETEIIFTGNTKRLVSFLSVHLVEKDKKLVKKEVKGTLWLNHSWSGVSHEGKVPYKNGKKPISLVKEIISLHKNKNAVVLDFFAGSGTTGHAVLDLNNDDNGNRNFILCQNDEKGVDISKEYTFKRISNIIGGNSLISYKTSSIYKNISKYKNKTNVIMKINNIIKFKESCIETIFESENFSIYKDYENNEIAIYNYHDDSYIGELVDKIVNINSTILYFNNSEYLKMQLLVFFKEEQLKSIPDEYINIINTIELENQ